MKFRFYGLSHYYKDLTEDRHSDFKEQREKKVKVAGLQSLQH